MIESGYLLIGLAAGLIICRVVLMLERHRIHLWLTTPSAEVEVKDLGGGRTLTLIKQDEFGHFNW